MSDFMIDRFGDPKEVLANLIDDMKRAGIVKVTGTYQGGHDEGGAEEVIGVNALGETVETNLKIDEGVDDLLRTKFGSWALGASVYGNFTVDAEAKRAWTDGEIEEWVKDKDPMEVAL